MNRGFAAVALVLFVGAIALAEETATTEANVENGKTKYQLFCAACHGTTGKGDGLAAAALDPKPADHSDKEFMSGLTDEYLTKVIREGGVAVGKSALMAAWGAALKDQDLQDVVAYIRTLAE